MSYAIGIDVGGTNLRLALYRDLGKSLTPKPVAATRSPVGDERSPEEIAARLAAGIEGLLGEAGPGAADGVVPVGIGIAAMLRDGEGTVARSPHLDWNDVPFGALVREKLGARRPAVVVNDVNAITYGEFARGAGKGSDDVLAVFVGTGIGGGLVAAGNLVRGATHTAGEIGHSTVIYGDDGAPCACGRRGCVEAYVGGHYVQRRVRAELAGGARSVAVRLAGGAENVTPGHIDQAAAEGDEYALELWTELSPMLAAVLSNAITLLNPGVLILGGGMLGRTPVFREHVIAGIEVGTIPAAMESLEIADAALGDDAGLVGSALLAIEGAG